MDSDESYRMREKRLPTLMEVLNRQTRPPVDLFYFYIYMRDQQRSVDYLDFWHFVREMRRSVLYETPELEKAQSKAGSHQGLDGFDLHDDASPDENGISHRRNGSSQSDLTQDLRVSQILRDNVSRDTQKASHSTEKPSPPFEPRRISDQSLRPYLDSSSQEGSTPTHTVTRADIRASAEKILYTYLLSGAEREIILPPAILHEVTEAIEEHGRDDPEVFDQAKDYVLQAMERDAYPGFLRSKALGNLVPPSLMLRLIVGLLAVFAGFWAAFVLVFLDKTHSTRAWIILPFAVGVYALASHQYMLDPLLALAGYSEYGFCRCNKMREPFVQRLLAQRSLALLAAIVLITAAVSSLFIFVPGTRL